ncbi:MAG: HAMP domain-containing histidine kinase [Acidobacteria bacterium]|nr:HAMP domain-containing histidine kinase [Acidobacteriota bacterium]
MAAQRSWGGTSRIRLTVMFLVVLLPPAVTLIWLGLGLLEQDRILEARREIEGREAAAEVVARSLGQSLAEAAAWSPAGQLPEGALGIIVTSIGVQSHPPGRILWMQPPPVLPEAPTQPFDSAEKAEFQNGPESALAVYRELARSADPSVRAAALLRVARVERKQQNIDRALNAYRSLATIRGVALDGTPADFLARRAICSVLEESSRQQELAQQAHVLETDFLAGRWILDRPTWELALSEIERWTGRKLPISLDRKAFSAAADWIWEKSREGSLPPSGRQSLFLESMPVTLIWRTPASPIEAIVIAPTLLRAWTGKAAQAAPGGAARLSLLTDSGEVFAGEAPDSNTRAVSRTSAETGLPWTLALSASDATRERADFAGRRRLLGWGLAAIVLLLAGGSYFLWRVMAGELAVARLQTDFVAAVSHEFRTPLTSLRHVTELLEEDDGLPAGPEQERRKAFYAALGRNTERLHRLVETLLDFSRMDTGKKPWTLEPMDAGVMAANVVSEFQKEVEARGVQIDLAVEQPGALRLRADAAALGHALWNLLDNAVKYSPEPRAVHVSVARHPGGIAISVRDEGLGIPAGERRAIFRKFVRGRKASELGIKGTGLGLAMVSHIAEAHGGAIELESEEGKGSTFRLVLPALA